MVEANADKPVILVTGVTGFLGSHTALVCLQDGGYRVKGTVRSKSNEGKLQPLKDLLGDLYSQLELVEADLMDKDSVMNAIEGANFVAHTASPVVFDKPEDEVIKPAVDGTLSVLEGCKKHGVTRVVVTSSMAAVIICKPEDKPADMRWTEKHWSDATKEGLNAYPKSKILAEKAAWKFVEDLPEGEKLDLAVVLPSLIMGPKCDTEPLKESSSFFKNMMGKRDPVPKDCMGIIDVRDCAMMHLRCIQVPESAGHRFFSWGGAHWVKDICQILHDEFASQGFPIITKEAEGDNDPTNYYDMQPVKDILGFEFRDVKETLIDTANSHIKWGRLTVPTTE